MKFSQDSLRSLSKLTPFAEKHPHVRFVFMPPKDQPEVWTRLGFSAELTNGEGLIPGCVGKVSTFNAHGKEVIRKDLPKVKKSVASFRSWLDWHGSEHTGIQHRTIDTYARELIKAPSEALYALVGDGVTQIGTRAITLSEEPEEVVIHLANLMLECFGEVTVIDAGSGVSVGTRLKRLQWEVLPPGVYPWSKAEPLVSAVTRNLDPSARELIKYRMASIAGYNPDFLATGKGGFNAYFVYGFESKGVFLLESGHLDNATYVFREDWERLSQLTKNEIINGDIPHTRVIHDRRWRHNLNSVMQAR